MFWNTDILMFFWKYYVQVIPIIYSDIKNEKYELWLQPLKRLGTTLSKLSNDASRKNYIYSHHKVLTPPRHDHLGLSLCSFFLPGHSHLHLHPWPKHQSESILPTSVNCRHAVKGQEGKQPFHHANGCSNTFICDKKEPSIYRDVNCVFAFFKCAFLPWRPSPHQWEPQGAEVATSQHLSCADSFGISLKVLKLWILVKGA